VQNAVSGGTQTKNYIVLPIKHDIDYPFKEAGSQSNGCHSPPPALFSTLISVCYKTFKSYPPICEKAVAEESNTFHPAKRGTQLAKTVKALPGFKVADAVARLNGDIAYYKELLADLCDSLLAALSELQPMIRDGESEEALIRIHGLKGMTGNLGAAALNRAFEKMEQALSNPREHQYESLIIHMERTIQQNLSLIGAFLQSETTHTADSQVPDRIDKDKLAESMRILADLLDQSRLDAIDAFNALRPMLHRQHGHPEITRLAESMRCLDYDSARKALTAVAESIHIDL
jgi:HPt (histidine-containing phosphotransfer) domain-containing protein